jgi:hypothetical protein
LLIAGVDLRAAHVFGLLENRQGVVFQKVEKFKISIAITLGVLGAQGFGNNF